MAATAPRSTDRKWRRRSVLRAVTGRSRRPCCPVMACGSATQPPTTPRRRPRCGAGDPACRAPIVCASRSVPGWTPRSGPPTPPGASTTASGRCADATRSGAGPSPGTPRPDRTARAGARPLGCGSAPRTSARRACAPPKPSAPSEPGPSDRVHPTRLARRIYPVTRPSTQSARTPSIIRSGPITARDRALTDAGSHGGAGDRALPDDPRRRACLGARTQLTMPCRIFHFCAPV